MTKDTDLYRILIKGGVLSPNELKQIVNLGNMLQLSTISFGSRQDILLPNVEGMERAIDQFPELDINFVADRKFQNVVSSYVSANIFKSTTWLKGSTYLYILSTFEYKPKLKVNIVDPRQRLVPLITGDLNFIASDIDDYWYLYLRFPGEKTLKRFPVLVFSWDIAKMAKMIEDAILKDDNTDVDDLYVDIINSFENCRAIIKDLKINYEPFPNYEGINQEGLDSYWLGLYWRNNKYDLKFLDAMADFCLRWNVGRISITPWKSFIVKGIPTNSLLDLEKMLGKFGINTRHSSLELNWHLPVNIEEALDLKRFIVRTFDQNDISTNGLTFGISNYKGAIEFTSIVIRKNEAPMQFKDFEIRPTYDVLYSENFDANTQIYKVYAQDVDKMELPGLLMELSKMYFDQLEKDTAHLQLAPVTKKKEVKNVHLIHQCKSCLNVYDAHYGDEVRGIAPGISFEDLVSDYSCALCDGPKENFEVKSADEVYVLA
ncbi:MAG: rubredoxin [Saprospiraceae bacterium]|nr:rubredoxin [Saprospiraceae bacterium]